MSCQYFFYYNLVFCKIFKGRKYLVFICKINVSYLLTIYSRDLKSKSNKNEGQKV